MKHLSLILLVVFGVFICVVGCEPPADHPKNSMAPVSYESLCGITQEQFTEMDDEKARAWLQTQYNLVPTSYAPYSSISSDETGYFVLPNRQHSVNIFLRQGHPYLIEIYNENTQVNFGQVVKDLGVPQAISRSEDRPIAYEGVSNHSIVLHYPDHGLSVFNSTWSQTKRAIQLKQDIVVNLIQCYVPANSFEVARQKMFPWSSSSDLPLPWPGFDEWVYFK